MDEIAAAVARAGVAAWDAGTPPSSPVRARSPPGWELGAAALDAVGAPAPAAAASSRASTKRYKSAAPSRFCHVCGRKAANTRVAACGRLARGLCRKVVCELCFAKHGWQAAGLLARPAPDPRWLCPHCAGTCPPKAQCGTYTRTNYKRHLALLERRRRAAADPAPMFTPTVLPPPTIRK